MNPELISKTYLEVIMPLTEWQQNYLSRNDIDGAIVIQKMVETLNLLMSECELDNNEILKAKHISTQWAERYNNDMSVANAKIKELQRIIQEEEYFRTRTKHDR